MLSRRVLIGAAAATASTPARARAVDPGPCFGDKLRPLGRVGGRSLTIADLPADFGPVLTAPVDPATGQARAARFDQILVLRLPSGPRDIVAFSAICTHAGCLVSAWLADRRLLHCPCHGSSFDPARNGAVANGPASRPLPSLPVERRGDLLVVAGRLSARPGGRTGRTD